jgi:cytosine/adenosine deaminase-related metal-dependent hydrolase
MLQKAGEHIVIGTDSLASNHQLDIISELRTLQENFPVIKLAELLTWATSNGARALRIEDRFGDLNKGKKPGIVLIEGLDEKDSLANAHSRSLL